MNKRISHSRATMALLLAGASVTVAHFAIRAGTHGLHVVHIIFAGLYLPIIIAAALWFGMVGAFVSAVAVSVVHGAYIFIVWPHQPMENANQFAMLAVYWVVADHDRRAHDN